MSANQFSPPPDGATSRAELVVSVAALLGMAGVFIHFAMVRVVDADEGFYLYASRLVMEGRSLYRDFFYPQMPLLPYLYGGWMKVYGFSWPAARLLSAMTAVGSGTIVYFYFRRQTGKEWGGVAGVLVFTFSSLLLLWMSVAKTYGFAILFALLAVLSFENGKRSGGRLFLSGAFIGLAVDVRLTMLAALPAFWWRITVGTTSFSTISFITVYVRTLGSAFLLPPSSWCCSKFSV